MKRMFALVALIMITASCGQTDSGSSPSVAQSPTVIATDKMTQSVDNTKDTTLSFPDGTKLSIPAGAFSAADTVEIEKPTTLSDLPAPLLNTILITAKKTTLLNTPATLTLKYDPSSVGTDENVKIAVSSEAIPEIIQGGETSRIEVISPDAIDATSGTVTVKINHFSRAYLFRQKKFYFVFDIPANFLKKADILYVLTNASKTGLTRMGGKWLPGHAAMYLGGKTGEETSNDGTTVIESTKSSKYLGVQFNDFVESIKEPTHIYLGAYRPKNHLLTIDERTRIAKAAISRNGWWYAISDWAFPLGSGPLAGSSGITCAALVEDSYDDAGISMLSEKEELLLLPIDQFMKTTPVNEIDLAVGQTATIGIVGVTDDSSGYTDESNKYSVKVISTLVDQGKASFIEGVDGYIFSYTPTPLEAEQTIKVAFTMDCGALGTTTEILTINVGKASVAEPPDYLILSNLTPLNRSKVTRDVDTVISFTVDYKLSKLTTGPFDYGKIRIELGGINLLDLKGSREVTYDLLIMNYSNVLFSQRYEEELPIGIGKKTYSFNVKFPAHDEGWVTFTYTPFFYVKLTRPDVRDRYFEAYGPVPEIRSYTY